MEVVATFYDEARAKDYAKAENGEPQEQAEEEAPEVKAPIDKPEVAPAKVETAKPAPVKTNGAEAELSQRQSAVLKALRQKMDENNLVAVRAAVLAQTANIPLGSLHSVLGSLEKKQLISDRQIGIGEISGRLSDYLEAQRKSAKTRRRSGDAGAFVYAQSKAAWRFHRVFRTHCIAFRFDAREDQVAVWQ